ncbi:hypothetical protein BDY17DRAFT_298287 [Neohortaea acidophila]|uniref:KANL3/Tex30 alpha/beta hydrolase-like domain-containing protein n=1 Tax=Neohortaea acidophila TaxID=245834 RepID=A0A6A6PQS6_9PEZI|nr:uncharacterized protein BDY17DRAFT_298287 [Neohortaea acidophila]KAF2482295.1 hypothetical protein BDY17DRAFT_298287 [Neohortaea acidophila]
MPPKKRQKNKPSSAPANEADDTAHSVLGGLRDPTLNSRVTGDETKNEDGVSSFKIPFGEKEIVCEARGSPSKSALIFTHGAGGGIANPAMQEWVAGWATESSVISFQGTMNLKSRVKTFHAVIEHSQGATALGGRSMGARAAVMTANELEEKPKALVLVSYPLTGGKGGDQRQPETREDILTDLPDTVDVLFVYGSEDTMCDGQLLQEVTERMTARSWLLEIKGADHGTSLKKKAGVQPIRDKAGSVAAKWLKDRDAVKRYCAIEWDDENARVDVEEWKKKQSPATKKRKRR